MSNSRIARGGSDRQEAAANAASMSSNMSHWVTIGLPGLASRHHTQHDGCHIVVFSEEGKGVFFLRSCPVSLDRQTALITSSNSLKLSFILLSWE